MKSKEKPRGSWLIGAVKLTVVNFYPLVNLVENQLLSFAVVSLRKCKTCGKLRMAKLVKQVLWKKSFLHHQRSS